MIDGSNEFQPAINSSADDTAPPTVESRAGTHPLSLPANDWQREFAAGMTQTSKMLTRGWMSPDQVDDAEKVKDLFDLRVPKIFFSGIENGDLTLARQVIPSNEELNFSSLELEDPIGDESWSPVDGITHRYQDRVLLKPTFICAVYCRFCFRRYKVSNSKHNLRGQELVNALQYIEAHTEIKEVILSGGDPLTLNDHQLEKLFSRLAQIDHIEIIRIHTRIPTALPSRVTDQFVDLLSKCKKTVWIVAHINSESEITSEPKAAFAKIANAGIPMLCQSVLLKGINDSEEALLRLFRSLIRQRVKPYYLHYPDLAQGTHHFRIPLEKAISLVKNLRGKVSGYALPQLIIDLPNGKGKVVVEGQWAKQLDEHRWEFQSPLTGEPVIVEYPDYK